MGHLLLIAVAEKGWQGAPVADRGWRVMSNKSK
jgi:hypothetical protein